MVVLIADNPGMNSYLTSLIEEYKKADLEIICGLHNFFYSNIKPSILHIQWPEKLYSWYPFSTLSEEEKYDKIEERLKWYKHKDVLIIHTIHNIKPHILEKPDFEKRIFELIIKYSDLLCHHCKKSIDILKDYYPTAINKKNIITPHGDYLIEFKKLSKEEARKKLNISMDKFVILNFGSQQKYKGENLIEEVFKKLKIKEKYLLIAGNYRYAGYNLINKVVKQFNNYIKNKINHKNKKYFLNTIEPQEIPYFLSASDVVFLAHSGSLNSGIISLAATYSKPVIYPKIGCFEEQMKTWIGKSYSDNNKEEAIISLKELHDMIKNDNIILNNTDWLKNNSWEEHVKKILDTLA